MRISLKESNVCFSLKYQKSAVFQISVILTPLVLFSLPALILAAFLLHQKILFILLTIALLSLPFLLYFRLALIDFTPFKKFDQVKDGDNIVLAMASSAVEVMITAERSAARNQDAFSAYHILSGIAGSNEGRELYLRLNMMFKPEDFPKKPYQEEYIDAVLQDAIKFARQEGGEYLEVEDLLVGLIKNEPAYQGIVKDADLDEAAVLEIASWHKRVRKEREKIPFWKDLVVGGVGQDWAYGYTPLLNQYAMNITKIVQLYEPHIEVFSRSSYISTMERILVRSAKNNVLLVGDHGVGKKTIIHALARKILDGKIYPNLRYKQIMQLNVGALLSGSGNQGEIVTRLSGLLREASRAGNVILFIDDFHSLVSSEQNISSINASEILQPYLQGSRVLIIGSTSIERYHKDLEAANGMVQNFEKIDVPEPSREESQKILEETLPVYEGRYGVLFTYKAIKKIIDLCERYIHDKPFPQKALDLADEVAVKCSSGGQPIISPKDVEAIITERTHVPVGKIETGEKDKLLNLENILHQKVIGQNEAIEALANALRRARSGLSSKKRPLGTFLFIGPTGVGKTETAKALAEAYFGSEERMVRFDMSEYQDEASVYRLIGAPAGPGSEGQSGMLTTAIQDNPFSLVLFDELEKAHPNILTLFLQVFDDGRLTGGNGRTVDFTNAIIIATSNAGSEIIRQYLIEENDVEVLKEKLLDYLQKEGIYTPEFLNRFDGVIAFRPLSEVEISQVAVLMISELNKQMSDRGISVELTAEAMQYLISNGHDPVFGARPMRRLIQDTVENALAKKMLAEDIKRGAVIKLDVADIVLPEKASS
jgi:ATP-dependent Clp protease ATP-binding subunit ClpC